MTASSCLQAGLCLAAERSRCWRSPWRWATGQTGPALPSAPDLLGLFVWGRAGCLSAQSTSVVCRDVQLSAQQPQCGGRSGARGAVSNVCCGAGNTRPRVCSFSGRGYGLSYSLQQFSALALFSPLPEDVLHFEIEIAEVVDGNCLTRIYKSVWFSR